MIFDKKYLKLFYENIDGISNHKFRDLLESSSTADYDVIAFSETWLNKSVKKEILDESYSVFRKDRDSTDISKIASQGGGVLVAIRSTFKCDIYSNHKMTNLEAICVKLSTNVGYIYIYCLYIQPTASIEIYREHVSAIELMMSEMNRSDSVIFLGDFNFGGVVSWHESDSGLDYVPFLGSSESIKANIVREVTNRMNDTGLFQISNFQNKSGNVLETVYTNMPEVIACDLADFPLLPPSKSDSCHVPMMCLIECSPSISTTNNRNPVYCFRKANFDQIRDHLSAINISEAINNSSDVNQMVNSLHSIIYDVFEKFVPKSSVRFSSKPKWHNHQLSQLKNKRNSCFMKLSHERKSSQSQPFINEHLFIHAKNEYETYRKHLFSDYLKERSSDLRTNPKSFWNYVNAKRIDNAIPSEISYQSETASSDVDKANIFAKFLKTVYVNHDRDTHLQSFINDRSETDCFNIEFSRDSVLSVLQTMNINKGSGHDGISSIFLRECAEVLSGPLCDIYSRSLSDATYPDLFKIGQITAIFKSGSKKNVENYRGVNVVPNLAKVFERLIYEQLKLIIPPHISSNQHGFLANRNIESNLMEMTTHIHAAFEQNAQLDVFYADISKAFDCVDTDLLVRKLAKYRLSNHTLRFFTSYLNDRQQYVKCNESHSDMFSVPSGVGQGTILGPLLFLVMFDDSDDTDNEDDVVSLNFADDKKRAKVIKCLDDAHALQRSINKFVAWCDKNSLKLNLSKCKIITFTRKKSPINFNYTINGEIIERVHEIRDLGVILDKKLTFNSHIECAVNKTKIALQFVKRQSYFFDTEITKILYYALVRSNIEFASVIWSPYHDTHRKTVESIQKQMLIYLNCDHIRVIEDNNYALAPYAERCLKFNLTSLIRRRVNACALFIHAIISGKINSPQLRSLISLNEGSRTLRRPEFIRIKFSRTESTTYSSFNNACHIFNHVALFVDPTLPHFNFRQQLLALPDQYFGPWTKLQASSS